MNKPFLKVGMPATEAIVEMVKSFPDISSIFLLVYVPVTLKTNIPDRIERHNPPEKIIEIGRENILNNDPHYIFHHLISAFIADEKHHLAFSSRIKLKGSEGDYYMPLMDFTCRDSSENLERVRRFLTKIDQKKGIVLASGNSYHYYGLEILSAEQWRVFMAKCLLSELRDLEIIDVHYIGHCLWDGFAILRISSSSHYPKIPTVVSILW